MAKEDLVVTLDFGTQSVRAIIFDQSGQTLACEQYHYNPAYFSTKPGYAEQDVEFYWKHMCEVTKALSEKNPELMKRVKGVSFTCFRDSAVLLDDRHKPLRPVILWCDQRNASSKTNFPWLYKALFHLVGMWETVLLNKRRTVANWIQENEKSIWDKCKYYWSITTYFTYKLTGNELDTAANYTGHYPINYKTGKWMKKSNLKYHVFNIEPEKLPKLVKCGTVLGKITKKCAKETGLPEGIAVIANGTDKGSETIGTGCTEPTKASISYGTASTVEVSSKKYVEPEPFLPAYPASVDKLYNLEVQIYRGYWMITWFKDNFAASETLEASIQKLAVEEVLNKELLNIAPGSEGLVLQPYWGPLLKRPLAKGTIVGFSDHHTRAHVYKAIIEGIAYALRDALESIQKRLHKKITEISVSGGGSRSEAICQITADIFGIPVRRVQTIESGCLGTAIVAYQGIGVFKTIEEGIHEMSHTKDYFEPILENHEKYDYLFKNVYLQMYPSLKKLNKSLVKYNRKYVRNEIL